MVDQIQDIANVGNWTLPIDMRFNDGHKVSIATYSLLMVISGVANITVLTLILKRRRHSRNSSMINTMLMNLAIADLLVTFLMMPLEIGWSTTVSWEAGDFMCRIMAFFRTFGLYLSGFVLMSISMDRYYAVLKPFSMAQIKRRGRYMLFIAWTSSIVCSAPQIAIFHVESHPNFTNYTQCVTYNFFKSETHDLLYKYFGFVMMYGLPLGVIIFCYSSILREIYRKYRDCSHGTDVFRRPSAGFLGRARIRTLKMTITIVVGFFVCWTPYYVMCLWYWMDKESAKNVDQRIQKGLFIFATANSIMNPVVYGFFNVRKAPQKPSVITGRQQAAMSVIPDVISRDPNVKPGLTTRTKTMSKIQWQRSFSMEKNELDDQSKCVVRERKIRFPRLRWQLRTQRSFSSEGTDFADVQALEDHPEVFEETKETGNDRAEVRRMRWRQKAHGSQLSDLTYQEDKGKETGSGWRSWLSHQGRSDPNIEIPPSTTRDQEKEVKISPWRKWISMRKPSNKVLVGIVEPGSLQLKEKTEGEIDVTAGGEVT